MLTGCGTERVYLACGATDMRKSIDTLAVLVQHSFELDPFSSALFVFCNRHRDRLKILQWDRNGFWLHYRRLEQGRFEWPQRKSAPTLLVTRRELTWLLDGLPLTQQKAHPQVNARNLI